MKYRSARLLNERSGWLGLSVWDLAIVAYTLVGVSSLLQAFGYELLAFPVAGVVFLVLLNIRLKSRPKTIRDYIRSRVSPRVLDR